MLNKTSRMGALVVIVGLAASGCGGSGVASETAAASPAPAATATREAATVTSAQTQTLSDSVEDPTDSPFVAPSDAPAFSPVISFITDREAEPRQRVFPFGFDEVFAVWEYRNMREGAVVRREWMLEDQVWLVREEPWDFAKYGADGTMRDISLYDHDHGLGAGQYTLNLYIDGVPQFNNQGWSTDRSFLLLNPRQVSEYTSPSGNGRAATVQAPGTLLVRDCDTCTAKTMVTVPEMEGISWFPDGQHIVYTVTDRSEETAGFSTIGLRFELWILDTDSGQTRQISERDEALWRPVVSPDGRTIAAMQGDGYCDAGDCGLALVFVKLDADLQRAGMVRLGEFYFGPADPGGVSGFPVRQADLPIPGVWQSATLFKSAIRRMFDDDLSGVYLFSLDTLTATRIGDFTSAGSFPIP